VGSLEVAEKPPPLDLDAMVVEVDFVYLALSTLLVVGGIEPLQEVHDSELGRWELSWATSGESRETPLARALATKIKGTARPWAKTPFKVDRATKLSCLVKVEVEHLGKEELYF
jgi:hypothetical protein